MEDIFSKQFEQLEEDDLRDLVEVRRVREHRFLEYKLKYDHGHKYTVEMLADITAMANQAGGFLIIGVVEDDNVEDGTPKALVGIDGGDVEASRIQSICLSSIEEVIPGLEILDVPLSNGKSCIIIKIPNSLRKPHMIVYQGHRSFRIRHNRSKSYMGMQEVRNMILNVNRYGETLNAFLKNRRQEFERIATVHPWFLLMATPIYTDVEKIDPLNADVRKFLDEPPPTRDTDFVGVLVGNLSRPTLHGIERSYNIDKSDGNDQKYFYLFRNSHMEFGGNQTFDLPSRNEFDGKLPLQTHRHSILLLHFLDFASQIVQMSNISEAIVVTAYWRNYGKSWLNHRRNEVSLKYEHHHVKEWKDDQLRIEMLFDDIQNTDEVARQIMDRLHNAYGYERSRNFDIDGKLLRHP